MKQTAFKKISILLGVVSLSFFSAFLTTNSAQAYTFTHDISTVVEVTSSTEAKVVQTHRLSWDNPTFYFPASKNFLFAYIYPAFQDQSTSLSSRVKSLRITSRLADNSTLSYTTSVTDGAYQVKIPYYEVLDKDNPLEFVINYTTDLYHLREGGLLEFSYPGLNKDFKRKVTSKDGYDEVTNYSVSVIIPTKQGTISNVSPANVSPKTAKDTWTYTFNSEKLVGNSISITVGDKRYVSFELTGNTYATNETAPDFVQNLLFNYIEIALPTSREGTESSGQQVYYTKIEPFPTQIRTDADGNILAKIPISASKNGEIRIEGYAILTQKELSEATKSAKMTEIPSNMSEYLNPEAVYWQVDSAKVSEIVSKLGANQEDVYGRLRKTMAFVSQNLSYAKVENESTLSRLGAVLALEKKVGVCMEYADVLLTLLRAQGIPTRTVFGDGVGSHVDRTLKGIGHQWVGVWFPGEGWVPVDPTWSDNGREYIGQDFDHFVWYVASKSVNEPSGFNCLSWDSQSPCKDALKISTKPVDQIPDVSTLMTLQGIQQQVLKNNVRSNPVASILQKGVNFLGDSKIGRILLSKTGMLVLSSFLVYLLLVSLISAIAKKIRARRQGTVG